MGAPRLRASVSAHPEALVTSRERFEAAMLEQHAAWQREYHLPKRPLDLTRDGDGYAGPHTYAAWIGWQLRDALAKAEAVDYEAALDEYRLPMTYLASGESRDTDERRKVRAIVDAALPAFDEAKGIEAAAKVLQSSLSSVYGVDANVVGIDEAREYVRAIISAYKHGGTHEQR